MISDDQVLVSNIVFDYTNGLSSLQCAKKYDICKHTVLKILKQNNVLIRTISQAKKKHTVNNDYFEDIDTPDKAYFLGLMVADGNNSGRSLHIGLQCTDGYILNLFKNKIQFSGNIIFHQTKRKNNKLTHLLCIYSNKISSDLLKYGVTPNKTYKTYFPDIPEHLWSHFIRGVFDGDGSIWVSGRYKFFSLAGTFELLSAIQSILMIKCHIPKNKISLLNNKKTYQFSNSHRDDVSKIHDYLYKDCDDLYLIRKRDKFTE